MTLRLLHEPDGTAEQLDYLGRVETQLRRWKAVSGHNHVTTVLDWGIEPRPWVTTFSSGRTLAEFGQIPRGRVLDDAIKLADAVLHLHRNGVVHAGLDPVNVAYPGDLVESTDHEPPLVDNVGLMNAFRFHFEPALHLDPRYAAPKYFDTQYGGIDHATDIYQLGTVIYQLFTGQAPYSGQFEEVRQHVLDEWPRPPSEVADGIPATVDDVVSKAMAKQKLTRYETVEHLQQELTSIRGDQNG